MTFGAFVIFAAVAAFVAGLFTMSPNPRRDEKIHQQMAFKLGFQYWEEWTGSRYERVENPILSMNHAEFLRSEWCKYTCGVEPKINYGSVCRWDPVEMKYKGA